MKNFRLVVKMMVMALAVAALFCSCNSAGAYEYSDAQESKSSNIVNGNGAAAPNLPSSFAIIIPEINVSVSGAELVKQSSSETTTVTAEATDGAQFIWYVNGMFQEGETGSTYELSRAYPGAYDVTCVAYSGDGALVKSASMLVTVTP
jgi:hypothetical protein